MLKVQEYLKQRSLEELQSEYGINAVKDEENGLVILNYDQIESQKNKFHPIVRECRALCLDGDFDLVYRSFYRFYNYGEYPEEQNQFVWKESRASAKEDGSLIIIKKHKNDWLINTRGSFGKGEINNTTLTWRELVLRIFPEKEIKRLPPDLTFVCELCSLYNKPYPRGMIYANPTLYLLSIFDGEHELSDECVNYLYGAEHVLRKHLSIPQVQYFSSANEVKTFLDAHSKEDPTFEGFVLRDDFDQRIKIKSLTYYELSQIGGNNGANLNSPEKMIELIMLGEFDEAILYSVPEVKVKLSLYKEQLENLKVEMNDYWNRYAKLESQKDFALAIKDCKLKSLLFNARKIGVSPSEILNNESSKKIISKVLEGLNI